MLKDITIGQFFPGESVIHKIDPRVKIVLVMAYIITLFMGAGAISYAIMGAFIVTVIKISGVSFKMVIKGLKPILFIMIFTGILNMFYTSGDVIWQLGFLKITIQGIKQAILMVVRIMLLIIGTSMLTYTTSPIQLTDGIESLLGPLKKFGAPVHELAMMMSIALRFIPTLITETDKIMSAQKARGADFDSGTLVQRAKALIPILIPLFISAFRRADELATAMECRLYRGDIGRTRMRQLSVSKIDYMATIVCIIVFSVVIALGFMGI